MYAVPKAGYCVEAATACETPKTWKKRVRLSENPKSAVCEKESYNLYYQFVFILLLGGEKVSVFFDARYTQHEKESVLCAWIIGLCSVLIR